MDTAPAVTRGVLTATERTAELYVTLERLVAEFGLRVLAAIAIFVIGRLLAKIAMKLIIRAMRKAELEETLVAFTSNLVYAGIMTFVIIAMLSKVGVETTSFVAVLGAAGLAVGLALQGSLANFAAGVLMILFRPFKVGDFIEGGGTQGTVTELQIFTTHLLTADNKLVIVPNSKLSGDNIVNYSATDFLRVDMVFGIAYHDDVDLAKKVLLGVVEAHPLVLKTPAPVVAMKEHGDHAVKFACRPCAKSADYWTVYFDVTEQVKKEFDKNGITIPFPQQMQHTFEAPRK